MKIEVFNVGHGHCSLVTAPNGARLLLDCGFGSDPGWFPSASFRGQHLDLLAVLNLDEDHVDDLPHLLKASSIGAFFSNPTVTAGALAAMKREGGMDAGVREAHAILTRYGGGSIGAIPVDAGEVEVWTHYNAYGWPFVDTNNLSLAVFVRYRGFTILFAGDLEGPGWRLLLERPAFRASMATVRVIVAAHHGRRSGISDDAFSICRPDIAIISDDAIQYASQETAGLLRQRTRGIPDLRYPRDALAGFPRRHVLTTRSDGHIAIHVAGDGSYNVVPEHGPQPLALPNVLPGLLGLGSGNLLLR
jgi:beta-lactamase superfamily II metal-dependent hydrolase